MMIKRATNLWQRGKRIGAALLFASALFLSPKANAEEGRPVGWAMDDAHEKLRLGPVTVHYEPDLVEDAQFLSSSLPLWWGEIERSLGQEVPDSLDLYLVSHAGRIAELTGAPKWAAGVANSPAGQAVVSYHSPDGSPANLESVTRHELAHVALHRAVKGHYLPRWFNEGVSDILGSEVDMERAQTLASAVFGAGVPERSEWNREFHGQPERVSAIYAASRDFVAFLRSYRGEDAAGQGAQGEQAFKQLIAGIRHGEGFSAAVEQAYGKSIDELESEWRAGLPARFFWYPLLSTGDWPMMLAVPLLMVAHMRRGRIRQAKLRRMIEDDMAFARA